MKIVTHGGAAHADDIFAVALIHLMEGKKVGEAEIVRSNESKRAREFSKDGADFVVDIGGDCDPRKGWFDHHQFPREAKPACAFTLVARKYKVDLSAHPWAEKMAVIDSKGPGAWFRRVIGRPPRDWREMEFVNGASDSFFTYCQEVANNGAGFEAAVSMARDWLDLQFRVAEDQKRFVAEAARVCRVVPLPGVGAKLAFFETDERRGTLSVADDLAAGDPEIIVAGMLDDRGDGYAAVRLNDDRRVDFLPRASEDGCVFAHNSGFSLKWRKDWDGYVSAVARSVRPAK